jgi:RNA polymerase sigma factor (sigma-70 family)
LGGRVLSERELAFIAIHKGNYPRVYKFVRRRVESAELAEELTADVFRVVWQKWDDAPQADIAWQFAVARNLIGNAYRSRDRQLALQEKLQGMAVLRFDGESGNVAVQDALAGLREKDRDILQLAYWDELSTAEIAAVLQCSESAAKVRLHRARAAFRRHMPPGVESLTAEPTTQKTGA